ncbi:hypothetical protein TPA0907_47690 [Micromonospora humidisoli]|uniref:acyl carrier protein n=1 Tax=Micromonospora sp. AKA109 TaxID=2733865 RepID=UPI0022BD0D8D|nr:acyl carrier protein [Micromonospora sp. AKA109]GHJ10402.1 hypothetical protein TPA0907_47690 [Micromonospora sp. AKA109]
MTVNPPWYQQLADTPLSERASALETLVVAEFKVWLLMGDADVFPLDESYFVLGLSSLGATEIQQRLVAGLGRPINAASLFNNPTAAHLLTYLRTEVLADLFPQTSSSSGSATAPVERDVVKVPASYSDGHTSPKDLLNDMLKDLYSS